MRRLWLCLVLAAATVASGAWQSQDVGTVPAPGGGAVEGPAGTWTIDGVGNDIWGTTDQFHFLYHDVPMVDDFSIACHMVSFSNTPDTWGKAGLMARAPNTAGGALFTGPESYVIGAVTSGNGTLLQRRDGQGVSAASSGVSQQAGPNDRYLKLTREGSDFALYAGPHPDVLQLVESFSPALISTGDPLYVGIAVCSHHTGYVSRAVVDQIDLNASLMTTLTPTDFVAHANGATVEMSWVNGRAYTELALYREDLIGGGTVRLTPGPAASAEFFTDTPGTGIYRYWLTGRYLTQWRLAAQSAAVAVAGTPGAGIIGADGFFRSWVMLGPIERTGGSAPGLSVIQQDYLDGAESSVLPRHGDAQLLQTWVIRGENVGWVGFNPGAPGQGEWFAYHSVPNSLDYLPILNSRNPDPATHLPNTNAAFHNMVMYNVGYLQNTSAAPRVVVGCVSSDDSVVVMLNNVVVWASNLGRGYGAEGTVQDRFPFLLPPGEHRLLVKVFQGTGGAGMRFRLENMAGSPLTAADGIVLRTAPAVMTSVPAFVQGPSNLNCIWRDGAVHLSWINNDAYRQILLMRRRSGETLWNQVPVGAAATSLSENLPEGAYYYRLTAEASNGAAASTSQCTVLVGDVCIINSSGYITSWLILGPMGQPGGANPPGDNELLDYLAGEDADTGESVDETTVLPIAGDRIEIDIGGRALYSTSVIQTPSGMNPDAALNIAQWRPHVGTSSRIDHNTVFGQNYDNFVAYGCVYVENLTNDILLLELVGATDDTGVWLLDNTLLGRTYYNGWVEAALPMFLPPGEHRLLHKTFEGGGGNGFQARMRDILTGQYITCTDPRVIVRTYPKTMTELPPPPLATAARRLPAMIVGEDAQVTVAITNGPVHLIEIVPANMSVVNRGGGVGFGQYIEWANTTGPVTYTVRPLTVAEGAFRGAARDLSNGSWLAVGGMVNALFPVRIGDWLSADFSNPGSPGLFPPEVLVDGSNIVISAYEGTDIWGTADEFHYLWKTFPADKAISVQARLDRFDPIPGANMPWSKAGVMFRAHASQQSPYVYAMLRSDVEGGLPDRAWQWRDASGAEAAHDGAFYSDADNQTLPVWIRAITIDGMVRGYFAPDDGGQPGDWTEMVPHPLNLEGSSTIMAGLAVTSHVNNSSLPVTAHFSGVAVEEVCLPVKVTRSFGADAFVNFEGAPAALYTEGEPLSVVLTLSDVKSCPGGGNVVIIEQLPAGWSASGITGGGVYNAGFGTITWTIPVAQVAAGQLRYTLSGYFTAANARVAGGVESPGLGVAIPIDGPSALVSSNGLDIGTGAIVSWLLLGPFLHTSPAGAHDVNIIRDDHLSDGTRFETTIMPREGDVITPDYGGASAAVSLAPAANPAINPERAAGTAEWFAWYSATGGPIELTIPALYGARNNAMLYSVCYLDVLVDELAVDIRAGSDDAIQILLNGEEIWVNPASRGWPGFTDLAGIRVLEQGVHTLMVKTFQGVGAWNFGVRLLMDNGWDPVSPDDLCVSLSPDGCGAVAPDKVWVRVGDANGDGVVNIADAITVLGYLFGAEPKPPIPCFKAADANNDNNLNIADAVTILSYLFAGAEMRKADGGVVAAGATSLCEPFDKSLIPATISGMPGCATPCAR